MKKFYLVHRSFSVGGLIFAAILFCTANFLLFNSANAQNYQWAKSAGGTGSEDVAYSVATDNNGNSYVAGYFNSASITFGSTTLTLAGGKDLFLVKYDMNGNILWAKSAGGSSDDYANSVAVEANGNVYLAGYFYSSSITFGSTTLTNVGSGDMYIVKYDSNGNVLWAKSAGGTGGDDAQSVVVDTNGNAYVVGQFQNANIVFDTVTLINAGGPDVYIVKYNSNGNVIWAKSAGGSLYDQAYSVVIDINGNSIITGYFGSSSITFGSNTLTNAGSDDIFIAKYDSLGNVLWAKSAGGTAGEYGKSTSTDVNGNILVAGYYDSPTITFDSTLSNIGSSDIFLVKYDGLGNVLWAKSAGGTSGDGAYSVTTDLNGNIYLTGSFNSSSITFGDSTFIQNGVSDMFLVKYDVNGNLLWAKSNGGNSFDEPRSVSTDDNGNVFVAGYFDSPTISFGSTTLNNNGSFDIFITKLDPCGGFTATITTTDVSCNGGSNGSAAASPTGGSSPYSYLWSNGASTSSAPGLSAGTYSVTVTDASGCTASATATITEPPAITLTISKMDATCNGYCDGNAIASVSGGTGGFSFLWSNGATASSTSNLCAGTVSLTVTDDNGCTATASVIINQPALLIPYAPDGNVSCFGACDGSTSAAPTGGTSPYSYSWSNGQTGATVTNLCAATNHALTVTDANGCEAIFGFTVFEPQALSININKTDVSCSSACNGVASAAVTGGVTPYSYMWNDPFIQTTQTATGLCPGSFNVTATDNNGCTSTVSTIIGEPAALQSVNIITAHNNCNGQAIGSVEYNVTGGTSPYFYSWSNSATTKDIFNLAAGTYTVTATDANGCSTTFSTVVTEPPPININITGQDATCNGCNNGSAQANVGAVSYQWSNGQTTQNANNLTAGNYCVTVTDANGCSATDCITINQPMQVNINFTNDTTNVCAPYAVNFTNTSTGNYDFYWNVRNDYLDTTINADSISFLFEKGGYYQVELCAFDSVGNNVGCAMHDVNILGFSLQMSASSACPGDAVGFEVNQNNNGGGGNGESSYTWDFGDGSGSSSGGDKNLHEYISEGTYTITVIGDHPQCGPDTISTSILITDTVMPTVYFFTNSWNSCPNDMVSFMPYNAPGIYTWDFGDGSPLVVNELFETEHSFPDTGIYVVTVSVTNSCGNSDSYSDTVLIQNNLGFYNQNLSNYNISPNPVCPGDQVEFRYEYPDNFNMYIWNFGDGNSDTNNLQTYHSYSTAGTYFTSITVVNGCGYDTTLYDTVSVQNNVPVNPGDYDFLPVPLSSCPGDSILFLAQDGAQSYMWHFGDGDSAVPYGIGSGDITAFNHAFSDTGTYYASLTITNGCGNSLTDTFPLPIVVSADVVPAINPLMGQAFGMLGSGTNETQPVCVPDSFIALTGGSLFHWDFGDGSPGVTTANIIVAHTYIYTGSYTVSLIAENSCGNSDTFSVMLNVGGVCPSPSVTVTGNDPTCFNSNNGNALASASGGTAPYSYQWSNGKTTALNGNLLAGTYSVTVTDVNGMTATGSITLSAPPAIILSMSANPASCGMSNGLASVTASGGATPYTYLWSNGQTSSIASNLAAGQYSVTVTAANGCKAVGSAMVNAASGFTATFTGTNITCNGASNGSAVISASGGTSPYSYSWSSGAASASLSGLAAGTYNATVTDNTGCAITGSVQVSQPPVLALILNGTNVSSCGGNNGSVNLTVFGGISPYTYLWNNNEVTEDISGLPAGIYTVTVTDANNCTKTKSVLITAPSSASLSFTKTNASCNSSCNGSASVAVNGGASPYFYNWSNGAVNSTASGLCAGTYSVSVVDSAGCAVSGSVTIVQPTALTINASSAPANCGLATGNAVADCDGGIPPYIYQWSSGDVDTSYLSSSVDSLMAGLYLVTGTDSNGCSVYVSVQVSDFGAPAINLNLGVAVSCYGGSDGEIDITVTGTGTPFTYQWSNGAISQDINNLVAGPYEVTVTNSNGCIAVESFNLPQPEALSLSVSVNNATCGNADGDAAATVSGGWTPYTYDWSNGGSAAQISNLPSQIYTITVTDDNGCTAVSSAAVGEEGGPLVTLDSITAANCAGAGSIYVSISDGVPPYTYNWDNGSVNEDLVGVLTGNYGLLVTDANGCTGAISAQIINTQIITDPICLLTVDTATGTNKIVWQKTFGNGISAYKIYRESSFAGVYQLAGTIPFDNLSVFTDSAANPLQHSWRYKLAAVDSCGNESIISASHKTMHVTVNLGIGNMINLIWDHYEGFSFGTYYIYRYKPLTGWVVQDSLASSLTSWTDLDPPSSFAGLRYYVEARHPDGCFATKSVENHNSSRSNKTYPLAPPAANLTATSSFSNEDGSCNGSATVTPSGGVSPYTYLWSNGDTTSAVDSLCAGSYSCTITDVDGDTAIVNVTVLLVNIARIGEEEISMIIYPNPNDGTFAVRCKVENKRCMEGKIVIYNLLGEVVCQSLITDHQSPYTVDLSAHGSGLYYLQLITEKGNSVPLKIVVQ